MSLSRIRYARVRTKRRGEIRVHGSVKLNQSLRLLATRCRSLSRRPSCDPFPSFAEFGKRIVSSEKEMERLFHSVAPSCRGRIRLLISCPSRRMALQPKSCTKGRLPRQACPKGGFQSRIIRVCICAKPSFGCAAQYFAPANMASSPSAKTLARVRISEPGDLSASRPGGLSPREKWARTL
jgi:hypothetical protein